MYVHDLNSPPCTSNIPWHCNLWPKTQKCQRSFNGFAEPFTWTMGGWTFASSMHDTSRINRPHTMCRRQAATKNELNINSRPFRLTFFSPARRPPRALSLSPQRAAQSGSRWPLESCVIYGMPPAWLREFRRSLVVVERVANRRVPIGFAALTPEASSGYAGQTRPPDFAVPTCPQKSREARRTKRFLRWNIERGLRGCTNARSRLRLPLPSWLSIVSVGHRAKLRCVDGGPVCW